MLTIMKNGHLKLYECPEMLFTFAGLDDASFQNKSFPQRFLKELFKANLQIFSSLRDSEFRCRLMRVDIGIISGNFRVNRKLRFSLKFLCDFCWKGIESKFKYHLLFLQFNSSCFKSVSTQMLSPTKPSYYFYWKYEIVIPKKTCEQ